MGVQLCSFPGVVLGGADLHGAFICTASHGCWARGEALPAPRLLPERLHVCGGAACVCVHAQGI